jgi:hypothetical protein
MYTAPKERLAACAVRFIVGIAVFGINVFSIANATIAAEKKTDCPTCRSERLPPWRENYVPKGTSGFQFNGLHDPSIHILDVLTPIPSRVCSSGGPSNALRLDVRTSTGRADYIVVREESCVDLFLPSVSINPSCLSSDYLCSPMHVRFHCHDCPNIPVWTSDMWARGYYLVTPTPSQTIMNYAANIIVKAESNPEHPIARGFFLNSETIQTLYVCAAGVPIHISLDALGASDDIQKVITACQYVQGRSMWVRPEDLSKDAAVNFRVVWP